MLCINSHKYWLSNEEYRVKNRKEIIEKLQQTLDNYRNGKNIFGDSENEIDIYSEIWKWMS